MRKSTYILVCAGCDCVEPWCRQCALFERSCSTGRVKREVGSG
jgi:hypothetical protein